MKLTDVAVNTTKKTPGKEPKPFKFGAITFKSRAEFISKVLLKMANGATTYGNTIGGRDNSIKTLSDVARMTDSKASQVYEVYDRMVAKGELKDFKGRGVREIKQYSNKKK